MCRYNLHKTAFEKAVAEAGGGGGGGPPGGGGSGGGWPRGAGGGGGGGGSGREEQGLPEGQGHAPGGGGTAGPHVGGAAQMPLHTYGPGVHGLAGAGGPLATPPKATKKQRHARSQSSPDLSTVFSGSGCPRSWAGSYDDEGGGGHATPGPTPWLQAPPAYQPPGLAEEGQEQRPKRRLDYGGGSESSACAAVDPMELQHAFGDLALW